VSAAAAAAADNDDADAVDGPMSSHTSGLSHASGFGSSSDACLRLLAAVSRFKSLAASLSHCLTDSERFHIIEDIAAALNIVLNSRRRGAD